MAKGRTTIAGLSSSRVRTRRACTWVVLGAIAALGSGCGRKATRPDCELIVDRNVEVKLRSDGFTDPAAIAKRKEELRKMLSEDIDRCVGKRVTDGTIACVQKADTPQQIEKCLR